MRIWVYGLVATISLVVTSCASPLLSGESVWVTAKADQEVEESDLLKIKKVLTSRFDDDYLLLDSLHLVNDSVVRFRVIGASNLNRVKPFVENQGRLGFWEVYNLSEVIEHLDAVNEMMANQQVQEVDSHYIGHIDEYGAYLAANPLFAMMTPAVDHSGYPVRGAVIGFVKEKDVKQVLTILDSSLTGLVDRVKWMAGIKSPGTSPDLVPIYALYDLEDGRPAINQRGISHASVGTNMITEQPELNIEMDEATAKVWELLTKRNIGRQIAMTYDGVVLSAPTVNDVIRGGKTSISGGMTLEQAKFRASCVGSGALPVALSIVNGN